MTTKAVKHREPRDTLKTKTARLGMNIKSAAFEHVRARKKGGKEKKVPAGADD